MPFAPAVALPADRPSSRRTSRIFAAIALLFLLVPAAASLPREVNAVAWLAGAGHADAFTGYAHGVSCNGSSCGDVTYGTLTSTGQDIAWPGSIPLGKPVHFRDPVWDFRSPRLDETLPDAFVGAVLGVVFDAIGLIPLAVFTIRSARARGALARSHYQVH
jgi:hypothetical protein